MSAPRTIGDMKQGLTGSRPRLSIQPRVSQVYNTRGLEYGADKYAAGNYYGPPPPNVDAAKRLLGYIDAAMRHLTRVSDQMYRAIGTGGDVAAAACTVDDDGGGSFPPSMLPDLAHALSSISIGITCGVDDGLLPADPGQPWKQHPMYADVLARRGQVVASIPQKDDPDGESRRIAAAHDQRTNLQKLNDKRYGTAAATHEHCCKETP